MRVAILALLLVYLALPAHAAGFAICYYGKPKSGCVYDGDTFWYENEKIRTLGYDSPEIGWPFCEEKAAGADAARDRLRALLNSGCPSRSTGRRSIATTVRSPG
jgi:endonuclease YncB( thermonuclease family)